MSASHTHRVRTAANCRNVIADFGRDVILSVVTAFLAQGTAADDLGRLVVIVTKAVIGLGASSGRRRDRLQHCLNTGCILSRPWCLPGVTDRHAVRRRAGNRQRRKAMFAGRYHNGLPLATAPA